jgi:hypothetical protein
VCTVIGIFCVYYVGWLLAGLEWNFLLKELTLEQKYIFRCVYELLTAVLTALVQS